MLQKSFFLTVILSPFKFEKEQEMLPLNGLLKSHLTFKINGHIIWSFG